MANQIPIKEFASAIKSFPNKLQGKVISALNTSIKKAMLDSKGYAPFDTGFLKRSAVIQVAKATKDGYTAGYIFEAPYAAYLEDGFHLNIKTKKNPKATAGYGMKGATEELDSLVKALGQALDDAWRSM